MQIRILFIDDDEDLLFIARHSLRRHDAEFVLVATTNSQDALQMLDEGNFDAVVCDFHLGPDEMNGLEILQWLREGGNQIPFIIFTGRSREEVAIQALNLGADYYLEKGEDLESLFAEIAHHLKNTVKSRRIQEALDESEEKYLGLLENLQDGVVVIQDGIIQFSNIRFAEIVGRDLNEVLGTPFPDFVAPEYRKLVEDRYRRRQTGEEVPKDYEIEILKKDGSRGHISILTGIVKYKGKIATLATIKDVTTTKKATEAFMESEERYKNLIENLQDGIIVIQDEIIKYANQQVADFLGYKLDEIVGKSFVDFVPKKDRDILIDRYQRRLEGETIPREVDQRILKKDGSYLPARIFIGLIKYEGRNASLATIKDMSSSEAVIRAYVEIEERYRAFFDQAGDSIFVVDPTTMDILDFNMSAYQSLGYTREEFSNLTLKDIVVASTPTSVMETIQRIATEGERVFDGVHLTKEGNPRDVRIAGKMVFFHGREVLQVVIYDITERKSMIKALRDSEEKHRALVENAQQGIVILTNPPLCLEFANEALANLIGYDINRVTNIGEEEIKELIHPDDWQRVYDAFSAVMDGTITPGDLGFEFRMVRQDGTIVWIDLYASSVQYDEQPALQCILIDVTEAVSAREVIKESEEQYRTLFESANDAIFLVEKDGTIVKCNRKTLDIFGCNMDDFVGGTPYAFSPEFQPDGAQSEESAKARINSVFDGESQFFGWVHRRFDGGLFNAEVSLNLITLSGKKISQAIVRDVTERTVAEDAIQRSEEEYRTLVSQLPVVSWTTDTHGNTTFISPNVESVYGFTQEEIYNGGPDLWMGRIHSEDIDRVQEQFQKLFDESVNLDIVYRIQRKDGKWIWLHDTSSGTYEKDGNLYASGVFSDITDKKGQSDLLKRQRDELSELGHMMSHDLGNKMNNIGALIELYKISKDDEILDRITASTKRAGDLLKISAELAGEGLIIQEKEDVDLDIVLESIAEVTIPNDIDFQKDKLPIVPGNQPRIEQIFQNVLENAISHGVPSKIAVHFETENGNRYITITNNGTPIPENIRGKIFARGFSTSKEQTGLGLSIVKKLVEAHGWTITLDDSTETVFRIVLN